MTEQEIEYWTAVLLAELAEQEKLAEAGEGDLAKVYEINSKLNKLATEWRKYNG